MTDLCKAPRRTISGYLSHTTRGKTQRSGGVVCCIYTPVRESTPRLTWWLFVSLKMKISALKATSNRSETSVLHGLWWRVSWPYQHWSGLQNWACPSSSLYRQHSCCLLQARCTLCSSPSTVGHKKDKTTPQLRQHHCHIIGPACKNNPKTSAILLSIYKTIIQQVFLYKQHKIWIPNVKRFKCIVERAYLENTQVDASLFN